MNRSSTPQHAALDDAPLHRDARDPADRGATRAGICDCQRYLAGGGEIQHTLVGDCDACGAITDVHVVGRAGGCSRSASTSLRASAVCAERRDRAPGRCLNAAPFEHPARPSNLSAQ